jgi:hypothetical protein
MAPVPRWWSRTRGLEAEAYESWRRTLALTPGRQPRILAWSRTADDEPVVLSPAALSIRLDSASADGWRHTGWHEIERGDWNAETRQLRWQTYQGPRGAAALPDPAQVPAVFQERVAASIVFERFVPLTPGSDRGLVVSGRRDLADGPTQIDWHTSLTRGVTWRTSGVPELADAAVAEARREFDHR